MIREFLELSFSQLKQINEIPIYYGDDEIRLADRIIKINNTLIKNVHKILVNSNDNNDVFLSLMNDENLEIVRVILEDNSYIKVYIMFGSYIITK
jgi:hypothetical protein